MDHFVRTRATVVACAVVAIAACSSAGTPATTTTAPSGPAYSQACSQGSTQYPVWFEPTSGTGRWQRSDGRQFKVTIVLYGPANQSNNCNNASGTADLRGGPSIVRAILNYGGQGSWRAEGSDIVVRFGVNQATLTLRLPMAGGNGSYDGETPGDGRNMAGTGHGQIIPR